MEYKIINFKNNNTIPFSENEILFFINKIEKINIDYEVLFKIFLKQEISYITNLSYIKEDYTEDDLMNTRIHYVFKDRKYKKDQIEKIKEDLHYTIKEEFIRIIHFMINNKIDFTFNNYNNFLTQNLFFSFKTKVEDIIYHQFNKKKLVSDFKFVDYYFSELIKIIFGLFFDFLQNNIRYSIGQQLKLIQIKSKIITNTNNQTINIDSFLLNFNETNINYKDNFIFFECQNHLINGIYKEEDYIKLVSFIDKSIYFKIPFFLSYSINIKKFDISFDVNFYFDEELKNLIFDKLVLLNRSKI